MARPTPIGEAIPLPADRCEFRGDLLPHRCTACQDFGWVKRFVGPLEWQHEVVRCACRQDEDSKRAWERARQLSDLSAQLYTRTFANYDGGGGHQPSHAAALGGVGAWCEGPAGWVMLWGRPGTGKTHLLAAAFNRLVDRGQYPLYILVPMLLDRIREGYETGDYGERFWMVRTTPILLLDDLGAEKRTEWSDQALFMLLDHRYRHELPTVVASNCRPDDLEMRIASRLQDRGLVKAFAMTGPDYRKTAARARQAQSIQAIHQAVQAELAATPAVDAAAETN